jgi:hypothetical protein
MRSWRGMVVARVVLAAAVAGAGRRIVAEEVGSATAVDVGPQMRELNRADWIDQDRRFRLDKTGGAAEKKKNARGVTTAEDAAGGCDGIKNGRFGFHVASREKDPWWQVDLGRAYRLDRVVIFNRTDDGTAPPTNNIPILLAGGEGDGAAKQFQEVYQHNGTVFYGIDEKKPLVVAFQGKHGSVASPGRLLAGADVLAE